MSFQSKFSGKASPDGEIRAQLRASSYPEIRRLDCAFADGVLVLRGRVRSFYLKQVAWSLIASVGQFDRFDDQVEVAPVD